MVEIREQRRGRIADRIPLLQMPQSRHVTERMLWRSQGDNQTENSRRSLPLTDIRIGLLQQRAFWQRRWMRAHHQCGNIGEGIEDRADLPAGGHALGGGGWLLPVYDKDRQPGGDGSDLLGGLLISPTSRL